MVVQPERPSRCLSRERLRNYQLWVGAHLNLNIFPNVGWPQRLSQAHSMGAPITWACDWLLTIRYIHGGAIDHRIQYLFGEVLTS